MDREYSIEDMMFMQEEGEGCEIFPIIEEHGEKPFDQEIPELLPLLPLRNAVLFPGVIIPITVGRDRSIRLVEACHKKTPVIGTLTQRNPTIQDPGLKELYTVGTVAEILKVLKMPDGSTSVIIRGQKRFRLESIEQTDPYLKGKITLLDDLIPDQESRELEAISESLKELFLRINDLSGDPSPEVSFMIKNSERPDFLTHFIATNARIKASEKQRLLEIDEIAGRGVALLELVSKELQMLELRRDIQSKVKHDLDQQQREYLLQQQIKTIQNELGNNPVEREIKELVKRGKKKLWSKEVAAHFTKEVEKLKRQNPAAAEYSVQINYLNILLDLPWNDYSKDNFDLARAREILNKDHSGLEEVKERILEHLAVLKLKNDMKSPILCLTGPPGVGKTSLGKSIASALGRQYVRMSLGGMHDESEIRGHRKTYIGAMPGRIIHSLIKAKTANPVFVLDEIDKLGSSAQGDPASALLEVLDPEQNSAFHDNFLEIDFDLSKVMFVATANALESVHPALRDRMEIISVHGYITEEKIEIAQKHLMPKLLSEHGVTPSQIAVPDTTLEYIIESYTRESGVRRLEKMLAKMVRHIALKIATDSPYPQHPTPEEATKILGIAKYHRDKYIGNQFTGVVTGLAWTPSGGEILYVETSTSKGKGKLNLTGNLGDVMKESAVIAIQWLKSHADKVGLDSNLFEDTDIHVHVPEGAIPKDGPSAGITIAISVASALTGRKVRPSLAMTGEITLRGKILPVGGIKEKILAAKRSGITEILLSDENLKDVEEIDARYLEGLNFHYLSTVDQAIDFALLQQEA